MRTAIVTGFDVLCANHRFDLETAIKASGMGPADVWWRHLPAAGALESRPGSN